MDGWMDGWMVLRAYGDGCRSFRSTSWTTCGLRTALMRSRCSEQQPSAASLSAPTTSSRSCNNSLAT